MEKFTGLEQKPTEDILLWNSSYGKFQIIFRGDCFLREWWSRCCSKAYNLIQTAESDIKKCHNLFNKGTRQFRETHRQGKLKR